MVGTVETDVRGYLLWSVMEFLEWMTAYERRFRLFLDKFESQERVGTPRCNGMQTRCDASISGNNASRD